MTKLAVIKHDWRKWTYLLCFLTSICVSCLDLNQTFEMKLVSDNMGSLVLPATLAGRDWSGLLEKLKYYGWGYYIFFTPVFALTHDPVVIYTVVCVVNIIVLGLVSVLIYTAALKFFALEKSVFTVILAIVSSLYVRFFAWNFTAELPSLLVVWLTVWLLLKAYSAMGSLKRTILYSILTALFVTYSYNIHTRLIILLPAIMITCLLFWVVYRKWFMNFPVFLISSGFGYLAARTLKAEVISRLWKVPSINDLHNATTNVSHYLSGFNSTYKVVLDILMSNWQKLNLDTYGVMMICVVITVPFLYTTIFHTKKTEDGTENQFISEKVFILICAFGVSLIGTLTALPLYYASGITKGVELGTVNSAFSAFVYIRYYYIYFGPIAVAAIVLLQKNIVVITLRKYICGLVGIIFLAVYILSGGLSHLYFSYNVDEFYYADVIKGRPYWNFGISVILLLIIFSGSLLLFKCNKMSLYVSVLFLINVVPKLNISQGTFFDIIPCVEGNATYAIISEAEKSCELPSYFYGLGSGRLQFMLNWKKMYHILPPEYDEEAIVISERKDSEGTETLRQSGYQYFVLDENECMWIKNEKLLEKLLPLINEYKNGTFCIRENLIIYDFRKIGKYVFANSEGSIEVAMRRWPYPVDGQYLFRINMEVVGKSPIEIGQVEAIADDHVIQSSRMILEGESVRTELALDVLNIQNLTLRVHFNDDVIIKNFEAAYTWSDE